MIREFRQDDTERVLQIANSAWQGIYRMYRQLYGDELFETIIPDEKISKGMEVQQHIAAHPECILICEEEGVTVGFATFRLDYKKKIGEIGNNAADPACRHKGIGQQLYKAVFELFRKEGMLYAKVHTGLDDAHAPARRAYERAGFNISHEEVNYFMKL